MKCINPLRYKIGLDNYDQFKPLIISFFKRRAVFRRTEKIFKFNRIYSTKIFCLNKRGSMAINITFYFCFFDLTINMFTIEQPKQICLLTQRYSIFSGKSFDELQSWTFLLSYILNHSFFYLELEMAAVFSLFLSKIKLCYAKMTGNTSMIVSCWYQWWTTRFCTICNLISKKKKT